MRVRLKLFAMLSDHLPRDAQGSAPAGNEVALDVGDDATVQQVIEQCRLPPRLVHLVLVNGIYVPPSARGAHRLAPGDDLAIWPPIAGG